MAEDRGAGGIEPASVGRAGTWAAWPEALGEVFERLPVGVAVYDARDDAFRVLYVNTMGRRLAGAETRVVEGLPFDEAYPDADGPRLRAVLRQVSRERSEFRHRALDAPSGRVWNVHFLPLGGDAAGPAPYVMGAGYEVTEDTRSQRHLEALLRSGEPLQALTEVASVARLAAEQGAALIPGIQCAVVVRDHADAAALRVVGAAGPTFEAHLGRVMPLAGSLSERALAEGVPAETGDADRDTPVAGQIEGAPQTARLVPLLASQPGGGRTSLGVIGFYRQAPGGFIVEERRLLDEFGARVATALHRASLLEEATARARRLRVGMDLALGLGASLDPEQVVETLLGRVFEELRCDEVVLLRVEGDEVVVEGARARSGQAWPKGLRIPITVGRFRDLLENPRPLVGRYEPDEVPEAYRAAAARTLHSLTVPILLHGEVYAALVATRNLDEAFSGDDVALLTELSPVAALALHNARLFVEIDAVRVRAEQLAARLAVGVEAAVELGAELEPRRVIRRLIARAVTAVGADRATFCHVDGDTLLVEDCYAVRGEPIPVGTRWTIADYPMLRTAVLERTAVQSGDGEDDSRPTTGAEHLLVVPLLSQGTTVATLGASRLSGERFDAEALAVLQQIGSVAVLALRNARLFEARRDFMNMAAHELRTPLTVLNGYLSMLRDGSFGPAPERWQQPLGVMAGKVDDLARLVDDLLIGARLERGAVPTDLRSVDLAALAAAAVERARPRAMLLRGEITLQAEGSAVRVVADADNIDRILDNLLNNALTYSVEPPRVAVRLEVEGRLARLAVEDHGVGVPAELQERIFEQFFRIEDRELGYPLGTGLGLYISRRLAEAQGGSLRLARSAPGQGSVFVLELPLPQGA